MATAGVHPRGMHRSAPCHDGPIDVEGEVENAFSEEGRRKKSGSADRILERSSLEEHPVPGLADKKGENLQARLELCRFSPAYLHLLSGPPGGPALPPHLELEVETVQGEGERVRVVHGEGEREGGIGEVESRDFERDQADGRRPEKGEIAFRAKGDSNLAERGHVEAEHGLEPVRRALFVLETPGRLEEVFVADREGEPDRVPFAELFHDFEIMKAIQGPPESDDPDAMARWRVRFWRDLGYDYVTQGVDVGFPHGGLTAQDTAALPKGQRGWVNEAKGPITSWQECEAYPWPTVTPQAFASLEAIGRALPDGMKVAASIPGGPLENLTFLMGFETFSYALVDQPDLVAAVAERVGEVLCQVTEATSGMEFVGAQWLNDDMGFKNGTLASPEVLRKYVFPAQKRICEITHRNGKPVLLHSCGKLDEITDELIDEIGIDAKHSFEHVIMPVWEAKRRWGGRMALLGGVDVLRGRRAALRG